MCRIIASDAPLGDCKPHLCRDICMPLPLLLEAHGAECLGKCRVCCKMLHGTTINTPPTSISVTVLVLEPLDLTIGQFDNQISLGA